VQRVEHPVDQRQLVGEVGDDRADVRQLVEAEEGRAALEVDQDQVELRGGVRDGQPEDEGTQQLGLARAGGPDHHAVRAHPVHRGLLEVQLDGGTGGGQPDRDA
jgi:hypothetical protein